MKNLLFGLALLLVFVSCGPKADDIYEDIKLGKLKPAYFYDPYAEQCFAFVIVDGDNQGYLGMAAVPCTERIKAMTR